jgi:hypothetical protein
MTLTRRPLRNTKIVYIGETLTPMDDSSQILIEGVNFAHTHTTHRQPHIHTPIRSTSIKCIFPSVFPLKSRCPK